jgi:hypothetical protein
VVIANPGRAKLALVLAATGVGIAAYCRGQWP